MKLGVGKRALMFLHWLISLLICAAFVAYLTVPDFVTRLINGLTASVGDVGVKAVGVVLLIIYAALAVLQAMLIFRRKKRAERGFISVDSGNSGGVRIAVPAIEQLVRQSVNGIDGIADMKIDIASNDDAIDITVNAAIVSGSHVPTITANMQRSIRRFVEENCGVAVREVQISINSVSDGRNAPRRRHGFGRGVSAKTAKPAAMPVEAAETVEPEVPEAVPVEKEPVGYDIDAPYVSEFEKDLAAMKAAETGDGDPSADGNGTL